MKTPGIISKTTPSPEALMKWLTTTEGYIQGLMDSEDKPILLADYQLRLLKDRSKFRAVEKSRGVGFSFVCAAEALAKAHLGKNYTAIFVSMNLEEAIEKIRYANLLFESLPLKWRRKKVVDNKTSIEFEDPTGRFRSRLLSHPCKDPRGKHNADVYLDEFAHYGGKSRSIYVAAVPTVSRGAGQLTVGSTPLTVGDLCRKVWKNNRTVC
jgi:phage FluMu gp28-like protein